jgi:hypothetical protein
MTSRKMRFLLIDCGRVSKRTRGTFSGPFTEADEWPNIYWG